MVINKEHRSQYIFISLSGAVTSALLILIYVSVQISVTEKYIDDRKLFQSNLTFVKPSLPWNYNNTWKAIGNATKGHKVYSAYFDQRTELLKSTEYAGKIAIGSVRIFAILPTNLRDRIGCIFRYDDFSLSEVRAEEAQAMHEDHSAAFAAWVIMCPLYYDRRKHLTNSVHLPNAVALMYAANPLSHMSPTYVQISYPRDMSQMFAKSKPTLSVCVGPVQFGYNNTLRIAEFVEMYRILGATHFYFYQNDGSADVMRLLRYYQRQGVANVLRWNVGDTDVHYGGIVAQFNECVLRAMVVDNHRYAAVVDFDEILMPLKHNSLADFLRQCDEGRTSAFVFRNVFYHNRDSNDTFNVPEHSRNRVLYTQAKVRRTVEIMPSHMRSKCIVNTRAIVEMGNHQVWRELPGYTEHPVHQSVGLLFHYRDKCINCKALLMVDYTARRFGSLIWDRVDDTCLHVFLEQNGICPMEST